MNPHQKPQEDVVVTQDARNAAASLERLPQYKTAIVEGRQDQSQRVQAFARLYHLAYEAGRRDMREVAEWQPIETAPRDKNYVLLRWRSGRYALAFWNDNFWDDGDLSSTMSDSDFTHWCSLPTEPLGGER